MKVELIRMEFRENDMRAIGFMPAIVYRNDEREKAVDFADEIDSILADVILNDDRLTEYREKTIRMGMGLTLFQKDNQWEVILEGQSPNDEGVMEVVYLPLHVADTEQAAREWAQNYIDTRHRWVKEAVDAHKRDGTIVSRAYE